MEAHVRWFAGLVFALFFGWIVVECFLLSIRSWLGLEKQELPDHIGRHPAWLLGVIERLFFVLVTALDVPGTLTAMMAWIAIKLAANWNRPDPGETGEDRAKSVAFALTAAVAGLISMGFALIGGLIARGDLWP